MKLILDFDTGIDDAMAIALALGEEDAEVIGITSVFGNAEVDKCVHNASAVLKLLDREDIPVFRGASHKLGASEDYIQETASGIFHGLNGLGNIELPAGNNISDQDAIDFIIESANKYGEELILVTTGPLTNVALAIQKDLPTMQKIKGIVSMGGALTVPGNVSPFAEANFWKDSEANNIVFDSGLPIKIIGLDVTLRTLITDTDIAPWLEMSEAAEVFHEIVTYYFKAYANSYEDLTGCALHDPLAVSVALKGDWVTGETFRIKSLYGEQEGRLVQDQAALNRNEEPNVFVALGVDAEGYNKHFLDTIVKAF